VKKVIVIDTELSCWDDKVFQRQQAQEVFEFGLAVVDLQTLSIVETGRYFIKNERHDVSPFCTTLTGITQKILDKQGMALSQATELMRTKYGISNSQNWLVAWGNELDWLRRDYALKEVRFPFHNNFINLSAYYCTGMLKSRSKCSLKKACARYGVEMAQPQHSAKADAISTANVLLAMVREGHIWSGLS
jgi:inhibitor of KinA sporulation pathway (predicted exonuclease)